ncbi:MAG TPA: hypothetical protein VGS78_12610 [Candidatus Sulfotelmatobacter sp.]|nr:hypothetical protein [Candidatus Sulfotelmatobacter sp.]
MIDLRKAEIFKRKMPEAIDGIVRRDLALANLLEQLADGFGVQESVLGCWSLAVGR